MLFEIVENRKKQVVSEKKQVTSQQLEKSPLFERECYSLSEKLQEADLPSIIAEFKRQSPSQGALNRETSVGKTTRAYVEAGASALSVLTEEDYFQGCLEDLKMARNVTMCPILRKDFIVDEHQVLQTKAAGADVLLLIAAALGKKQLKSLYDLAKLIGLEVLFEIHEEHELDKLPGDDLLIGVNNRNLKSMKVDLQTSFDLAGTLSKDFTLVSESGIGRAEDVLLLQKIGYAGFLMGTHFMQTKNPPEALRKLMQQLENKQA